MFTNWLAPRRTFDGAITEMMDRPQGISGELATDLENLEKLNRYFGSYALIRYFLRRWLRPGRSFTAIDLCTGFGDIPRLIVQWCRTSQIAIRITAVDFQPATLELAMERSKSYPEITFLKADALKFVPDCLADLVFCSLALHHFGETEAIGLLQNARAMTQGRILIADLERTDFGIAGIYLLTACAFREPMTRFDARLSIRRAFSFQEMRQLASAAGWKQFGHRRFPVCRQAIWLES